MWCTKLIGFAAFLVLMICKAGELAGVERSIRVDAEQDPFETLTLVEVNADGPSSTLFRDCLAATRTLKAQLFSIDIPETDVEFIRHVPDILELQIPIEWKSVTKDPLVSSIMECAAAVFDGGYPMFKYNGDDDCKAASKNYDLDYESACETGKHDAVFISNKASRGICRVININIEAGTGTSITVCMAQVTRDEARIRCEGRQATLFGATAKTTYADVVQIVKDLNVTTSNFLTNGINPSSIWLWAPSNNLSVPSNLTVAGFPMTGAEMIMYMKGAAEFLLDFAPRSTFKAGFVCMAEDVPLK